MNRHLEVDLWAIIGTTAPAALAEAVTTWATVALAVGRIQSLKQVTRTLEKWADEGCWSYGVALWNGWPVPGKRPRRLEEPVCCIGCEATIAEGDARNASWRWATVHTGEPDWLCRECLLDDADNPWS
jgi:hypothetical protein